MNIILLLSTTITVFDNTEDAFIFDNANRKAFKISIDLSSYSSALGKSRSI